MTMYVAEDLGFIKVCTRCGKNKEEVEFAVDMRLKSGRRGCCKSCVNKHRDKSQEARKKNNVGAVRWRQENREKCNMLSRESMRRLRAKLKARDLKSGK